MHKHAYYVWPRWHKSRTTKTFWYPSTTNPLVAIDCHLHCYNDNNYYYYYYYYYYLYCWHYCCCYLLLPLVLLLWKPIQRLLLQQLLRLLQRIHLKAVQREVERWEQCAETCKVQNKNKKTEIICQISRWGDYLTVLSVMNKLLACC